MEEQNKSVRKPQQSRSIITKEKILDAAYLLFCSNGYNKTTTNEIAKVAGVSIGSLYSYFNDKDTIFIKMLDRYNNSFTKVTDELSTNMELYKTDPRTCFRNIMDGIIKAHQNVKELNREIKILCYTMPEVAVVVEKQDEMTRQIVLSYLSKEHIDVNDIEATTIVIFNLMNSIVDQIVFCENTIDSERILQSGVDALCKILM